MFSLGYTSEKSIEEHHSQIKRDIKMLNKCDYVIAHNRFMTERLKLRGCVSKIFSINIFDYYSKYPIYKRHLYNNQYITISFAGCLSKSGFLSYIDKEKHPYSFNVYGKPKQDYKNLHYMGALDPEILTYKIEGNYGLIWEGNKECISEENNYTCINNPHKLSMYLVAGMPVIVWKHAAIAEFVINNGVGIIIEKIDDIIKVKKINSEQYDKMVENCLRIRKELVAGAHTRNVLNNINADLRRS